MSLSRLLLLRRSFSRSTAAAGEFLPPLHYHTHHRPQPLDNPNSLLLTRSFAYSSAEEAAAERRRRKRRLRIEPPVHALQRDITAPRPRRDPNQPDATNSLVGPRLSLHNRVQSLIRAGDLDNAAVVARKSVYSSTRPTVFTCNAIIGSMYRAKRYSDALALFTYFFRQSNIVPSIVSYNYLISTHCDEGEVEKALEVCEYIKDNAPFKLSPVTYAHLTKGLIDAGRIGEAVDLLREMEINGLAADSLVYNNLICGFLNLGNLEKANELFDELQQKCLVYDGVVTATFMEWFFNKGRGKEAMKYYRSLLDKKFRMVPATCNVLLQVLLKWEKRAEAEALFDRMLDSHTPPVFQAVNSDTFSIMVNECFKIGKGTEAYGVFKKVGKAPKSRPFAMDTAGFNNIIARYCENEMMEDAEKLFMELCGKSLTPDVNTYRALIDAYFKVGRVDDALAKYMKMVDAGLRVIPTYADRWFSELIEKGKIVECATILTKMCSRDPKPETSTYELVVRALCGNGYFDTSLDLFRQMVEYGVGIGHAFEDFAQDAFDKIGRRAELDQILNMRRSGYAAQSRNTQQPGTGTLYGSPRLYESGSQYGNTQQQDESRPLFGNAEQRGPGTMDGNPQQYESGAQYGNAKPQESSPLY